jgi:V8-like Glu-specific endopeptidase
MPNKKYIVFLLFFISLSPAFAQYEIFQADLFGTERFQQIKAATAALVTKDNIANPHITAFGDAYRFCTSQKFLEEKLWSNCSGVLIAKDVILTAGHCIHSRTECTDKTIVFDYRNNEDILRIQSNPQSYEYRCKKILYWSEPVDKKNLVDFALIQLDRPVLDRQPISLSKNKLNQKQDLFTVGHPLGLPMKVSAGFVSDLNAQFNGQSKNSFYKAQVLTHPGLSGGAVYDSNEQLVGLLVRGEANFESDDGRCLRAKECNLTDCPWAEVQKLQVETIRKYLPR